MDGNHRKIRYSLLALLLMPLALPTFAEGIPEDLRHWAPGITSSQRPSPASFAMGANLDNSDGSLRVLFESSQLVDAFGYIRPAPEAIGKKASLYAMVRVTTSKADRQYMLNEKNRWVDWFSPLSVPVSFKQVDALSSLETLRVLNQLQGLAGKFEILVGYRTIPVSKSIGNIQPRGSATFDSDIHFNATPLRFEIVKSSPTSAKSLSVNVTGNGKITSAPAGINCGNLTDTLNCNFAFADQTTVLLSATPAANTTFTGWGGACSGSAITCSVTMDAAKTVTAHFTTNPSNISAQLNVTLTGSGSVVSTPTGINCAAGSASASCSSNFSRNTLIALTATPDANFNFSGWSGACTAAIPTCTLTLDALKTVAANFTAKPADSTVALNVAVTGSGKVVSVPLGIDCAATENSAACAASFPKNTTINLTATAATNFMFNGWNGACVGTEPTCRVNLEAANSVSASFIAQQVIANSKLNDTGITRCANESLDGFNCPVTSYPGQDAEFGRDISNGDDSDGRVGFSFTKISSNGQPLLAAASAWDCVKDNVTGLMWENKTDDAGLHDKDWTYSWYQPDNTQNGGNVGLQNGGACGNTSSCDTFNYVLAVNATGWCGFKDWRLPTDKELLSLIDLASGQNYVDRRYFPYPNKTDDLLFWSSVSMFGSFANQTLALSPQGSSLLALKSNAKGYIRLVR